MRVEAQTGVYFGRDTARNHLQNLGAEADEQFIHEGFGLRFRVAALFVGMLECLLHEVLVLRTLCRV